MAAAQCGTLLDPGMFLCFHCVFAEKEDLCRSCAVWKASDPGAEQRFRHWQLVVSLRAAAAAAWRRSRIRLCTAFRSVK
jgi:hypothetical protein